MQDNLVFIVDAIQILNEKFLKFMTCVLNVLYFFASVGGISYDQSHLMG